MPVWHKKMIFYFIPERNTIFLISSFTSTSVTATGNETFKLADEVKKYDTAGLISFLRGQDLRLSETAPKI